eukprot:2126367-Rhodomonas_salina.1
MPRYWLPACSGCLSSSSSLRPCWWYSTTPVKHRTLSEQQTRIAHHIAAATVKFVPNLSSSAHRILAAPWVLWHYRTSHSKRVG